MLGYGAIGQFTIGQIGSRELVTLDKWFAALSEPVRFKLAFRAGAQQFFAFYPFYPPPIISFGWFMSLTEPVRFRLGLRPPLQQFLAAPSRLLPTPTLFGRLSALETKDIFLAGASFFNPPASAEIGIVDTGFPAAEIGVAVATVASVSISIQIV